MLMNIDAIESLRGLARLRARNYTSLTVHSALEQEYVRMGWGVEQHNSKSVRLKKRKTNGVLLEDRVWSLLYRMGFGHLSGVGGGDLKITPKDPISPITHIDVVGIDTEVALAVECKSSETLKKRPEFQEELGKHALIREKFANSVNSQYPSAFKRQVALAMFTSNVILTDNDKKRAQEANVVLFDEHDLSYYENLVGHLGTAAKYQFLADLLPGKPIPGLAIKLPAIRTKMGGVNCYTFSVSPEYLLKISFVSHRAKGKASDVNTYQRMIVKSRLNAIRKYIEEEDGIFPTNIVVNLDRKPTFQRTEQEPEQGSGVMGWLDLRPSFKSAWIIDGQHRLFAYSGLMSASKARLSVLAFENLSASKQAQLFSDINAQQKRVKQSLLQELYAELHWDATDPEIRVRAIVSKAVQTLDADPMSPFFGRIVLSDEIKDTVHCITLGALTTALQRPGLFIATIKKGNVVEYGPLWAGESNTDTLNRTVRLLNSWFNKIRDEVTTWWNLGSDEGGGLAMNDAVTACLNALRSVFHYLETSGTKLVTLEDEELVQITDQYAVIIGQYLASLTEDERKRFRDLRGGQGQTTRTRRFEQAIHDQIPAFNPPELRDFLEREKAQTNIQAKEIVDRIEKTLQRTVVEELRREYGSEEAGWWMMDVPRSVRAKVTKLYEEDDGKRGGKEYYFDLIDYRSIAQDKWELFEPLLAQGKPGTSKEKRTGWMNEVNGTRRVVAHASAGVSISIEELEQLEQHDTWLTNKINGATEQNE